MKLIFKQRFFSWFDSYDIYDESGATVFTVEGKLSWGHRLHILDHNARHVGTVREELFTFLPAFELYEGERYIGVIKKDFSFFKPSFSMECGDWSVKGDWFEWDYEIRSPRGIVATVSKELFEFTDTYVIDLKDPRDALHALMVVLAIDAEKCSRK